MENFIMLIITIVIITIASFVICVVISAINYVKDEVTDFLNSFKRNVVKAWWDIEWQFKRR